MSYRQVSQEYGDESDEEIELRPTSSGPRYLGPPTALDRLSSTAAPPCSSGTWQLLLFLVGLIGVYFYGIHEGKSGETGSSSSASSNNGARDPFKTFHPESEDTDDTPSPTVPAITEGTFTMEKLLATRSEVEKLLSMLETYYTNADQTKNMLLNAWTAPWDFDSIDETTSNGQRILKLVDTMARALVTDDQTTFLMGGIGSSVMAGHDNCHYDAYQNQMERTFGSVWEKAGMEFVFQNAGEGGGCGDR